MVLFPQVLVEDVGTVAATVGTIPAALWLVRQRNTAKVEPFNLAGVVLAENHFTV
jgi:hypothetical protein